MMRKMHKHFYTSSGMFLLVAGAVGLSGVITTFSAVMAGPPVVSPHILAMQSGPFLQSFGGKPQPINMAIIGRTAHSITVQVVTNADATGPLQFSFVPLVGSNADAPRTFSESDAMVQNAAVHAVNWSDNAIYTFPIDDSMTGKWITIYAFVKNSDSVGAIPGLPNNIDGAGAAVFQVTD